jgi:hypothetical protein
MIVHATPTPNATRAAPNVPKFCIHFIPLTISKFSLCCVAKKVCPTPAAAAAAARSLHASG